MAKDGGAADPLRNPRFQEPSVWQLFRESLFGKPACLTAYRWKSPPFARGAASIARIPRRPDTGARGTWKPRPSPACGRSCRRAGACTARLGRTVPAPAVHGFRGAGAQGGLPGLHNHLRAAHGRNACRANRGERHRHCGLFLAVGTDEPAMPARACRSAASVRPCARSSASAKPNGRAS